MTLSLRARVVYPVDRPAIEHGVVTTDGERIVAVGTKAESGDVTDLGPVALMPGLVNCHTHLEFSHLQRPLGEPSMALVDWIRLVIAERGRRDSRAAPSIAAGLVESGCHGVSTLGDIAVGGVDEYVDTMVDLMLFGEVIGFSRTRAASALLALHERLDAFAAKTDLQVGISPHSPYTVSPDLLSELIALAGERGLPVAMHLAESAEELELLDRGTGPFQELLEERSMWDAAAIPRGSRPIDYLRLLAEAPRAIVIHGNYLDDEEHSFLAANAARMSLVYCPRTHSYFRHPPYPLPQLLAAGVRVALGTDSRASNPDLDLLAEMRHVARAFQTIEPNAILRLGTLAGAEALGRGTEVGSITPGKFANLVAVPLPEDARGNANEMLNALLDRAESPCGVWFRGVKT
jgi:cytosine/adenosine deaminase-related metal-dependent hydrolase